MARRQLEVGTIIARRTSHVTRRTPSQTLRRPSITTLDTVPHDAPLHRTSSTTVSAARFLPVAMSANTAVTPSVNERFVGGSDSRHIAAVSGRLRKAMDESWYEQLWRSLEQSTHTSNKPTQNAHKIHGRKDRVSRKFLLKLPCCSQISSINVGCERGFASRSDRNCDVCIAHESQDPRKAKRCLDNKTV